jgi:hypothetical protein
MKGLLASVGISFLVLIAWAPGASAGCDAATGNRTAPFPAGGDNCFTVSPSPTDSNGDGFGNACDADYNPVTKCKVTMADFVMFRAAFGSVGFAFPDQDHSEPPDGIVGAPDFIVFSTRFGIPLTGPTE